MNRFRYPVTAPCQSHNSCDDEKEQDDSSEPWTISPEAPGQHRPDDEDPDDDCGGDGQRVVVTEESFAGRVGAVLAGDEEPPGQVEHDTAAAKDRQQYEGDSDQDRVDAKTAGDSGCHAAEDTAAAVGAAKGGARRWWQRGRGRGESGRRRGVPRVVLCHGSISADWLGTRIR